MGKWSFCSTLWYCPWELPEMLSFCRFRRFNPFREHPPFREKSTNFGRFWKIVRTLSNFNDKTTHKDTFSDVNFHAEFESNIKKCYSLFEKVSTVDTWPFRKSRFHDGISLKRLQWQFFINILTLNSNMMPKKSSCTIKSLFLTENRQNLANLIIEANDHFWSVLSEKVK